MARLDLSPRQLWRPGQRREHRRWAPGLPGLDPVDPGTPSDPPIESGLLGALPVLPTRPVGGNTPGKKNDKNSFSIDIGSLN
ncbi:hypothetical protein ABT008_29705 [Micromonospora sp. NPDC002389]|uniref:hypothetical protein n=1 Tax=Micromonospora sp. NPDC002389 TaxID=3154272 RepID=UPI0033300D65